MFLWYEESIDPPPTKKVDFFQAKCKIYSACTEKPILQNHFSVFCTGSNEIFKKERLCTLKGLSGGVGGGGGGGGGGGVRA